MVNIILCSNSVIYLSSIKSRIGLTNDSLPLILVDIWIQRLVTKGDKNTLLAALPAIKRSMLCRENPCTSIRLVTVSAATCFKIYFIKLLCNTNIRLKLRHLKRRIITVKVTNTHNHKLNILYLTVKIGHDKAEFRCNFHCSSAHRASDIKSKNYRYSIRMLVRIATFTHLVLRIKSCIELIALIHILYGQTRSINTSGTRIIG